jgi:integrase/recombinase XerD
MLESYFKRDSTLRRLRAEPTGWYMDGFAKTLHTKGYGLWAGQAYLRAAAHLGIWIKRQGFSVTKLDNEVIREFARHLPSCHCLGKNHGIYDDAVIGARHFLDHLRDAGVVQASAPLEKSPLPTIIDGFEQWMRQHRGVCESTLTPYRSILIKLLGAVGEVPGKYNAHCLRRAVELQTSRSGRSWAKLVITTVRMFLRYLVVHNLCDPALVDALPTIAHWKRASCPDYLLKEEVEKLIVACNPATAVGARDRAVLLLLVRLGLRAGIGGLLRHQSLDTTALYAKIDVGMLSDIAQPWPGEVSPC